MSMQTKSPNDSSDIIVMQSTSKNHQRKFYRKNDWLCDRCGSVYRYSAKECFIQHMVMHTCPSDKPYKCEFCHLGFHVPSALKSHRRVHQKSQLKCDKCDKVFTRKQNYLGHMLIHEGKEPFKCDLCGDEFAYRSLLKYHMRAHTGEHFACEICDKQFSYKASLSDHMKLHCKNSNMTDKYCQKSNKQQEALATCSQLHKDRNHCDCSICEKMRRNGKRVRLRPAPHHFGFLKPFSCTECNMKFYAVKTLRRHMENKHKHRKEQREKKQFVCGHLKCKAKFSTEEMLNTHKLKHNRKNLKKFSCGLCSKEFMKNITLYYHMMEHSGKYECEVCGAILKSGTQFRKHRRQHFTRETHPYPCHYCDRLFRSEKLLKDHLKCHTTICKYCLLECPSEKDLENHLIICKQANRCNVCDARFGTKSLLENHLLLHEEKEHLACPQDPDAGSKSDLTSNTATNEGKKAYECDLCDMSYLSPTHLTEHLKVKHRDDQFKCDHCDKAFRRKNQLEKHMMEHSGKYECEVCGAFLKSATQFRKHRRQHFTQKTRPYPCHYCGRLLRSEKLLRAHLKCHTTICKYCLLEFPSEKDLENHLIICKQANRCNVCDATFGTKSSLENHLLLHDEKEHLACLQGPATPSESDVHVTSNTATKECKKAHECDFCDMSFLSVLYLAEHVKEKHKDDLFKCGHCDTAFRWKKQLEKHVMTHMMTHIKEKGRSQLKKQNKNKKRIDPKKPFQCDICEAQLSSKVGLLYHQRVHKGNIQLNCQQCDAKFSDVEEYVTHQSTHGDLIKPFQCGYCDISFGTEDFFAFHMRTCEIKKNLHTKTILKT